MYLAKTYHKEAEVAIIIPHKKHLRLKAEIWKHNTL